MIDSVTDPIRAFEHVHGQLNELAAQIGCQLRDDSGHPRSLTDGGRKSLVALMESLSEQLLQHFADEEEALFPFVRKMMPVKGATVDKLETSHSTICGAVVRLAYLATHKADWQLLTLYERFEELFAEHTRAESELFAELGRGLGQPERAELASLLSGLARR